MYAKYIKRILDFILSLIALIVLSPVLLVVAILVRIKLGSPIIFKQQRPGKDEKIFTLYKFRTMTDKKDENGNLLPDSERLTKFRWITRACEHTKRRHEHSRTETIANKRYVVYDRRTEKKTYC